jgi:hypothetical protein
VYARAGRHDEGLRLLRRRAPSRRAHPGADARNETSGGSAR